MGGNQTAIFQQGQPLSNYDVVQKVPQHNVSYLKHKISSKQFMIKQSAINDKTQFAQMCQKLKNRKKMQSPYLTKLERFSQQLEDHLCSSFYKVFAMWEYPTHTLSDQINERALQKRRFEEKQIFSIIASVIQGMNCLQSSGIKHQSLTTTSILFDQTGTVKIADPLTEIHPVNFQRVNSNRKIKNVYIAPQQCQSLKSHRPIPNRNPFKSDVFVLGVILLQCGLLQRMNALFIDQFEDIDCEQLTKRLQEFGRIYSRDLRLTVQTMLNSDPKQRMDWIGLKQYIPQKDDAQRGANAYNKTLGGNLYRAQTKNTTQTALGNKLTQAGKTQSHFETAFSRNPIQNQYSYNQQSTTNSNNPNFPLYYTFQKPLQSFNYQSSSGKSYLANQNIKTSNQIYETKPSVFQRPTQQFLGQTNIVPNSISKLTTTNPLVDRDSSSFPLNSHFEFKRDYLLTGATLGPAAGINNNATSSAYTYTTTPLFGQNNEYGLTNINTSTQQHYISNQNQTKLPSSKFTQPSYTPSSSFNIPQQPQSTSGINNFQLTNKNHFKSSLNNDKTDTNGNYELANSPFMNLNYVKDTKSITCDKGLYGSYINDQRQNNLALNSQQQHQQSNFSSNMQPTNTNQPGYQYNNVTNDYYQPITREYNNNAYNKTIQNNIQQSNNAYVGKLNALSSYQAFNGDTALSAGVKYKEKPFIPSPSQQQSKQNVHQKLKYATQQQHQNTQDQHKSPQHTAQYNQDAAQYNQPTSQYNQQQYQYKPINQSQQQPNTGTTFPQQHMPDNSELQYVIQHFKQGSRYEGTKYQDMRHGQGKFYYQDGGMYQGKWRFNKMDGFGKLYYQSGKIAYEGNWKQDQFQGYGKLYNQQPDQLRQMFDCQNFDLIDQFWAFYQGNFVSDQKDGQGKMAFSNGEYFVGNFHRDMVDGPGEFHRLDNQVIKGVWSQNQLVEQQ